MNSEELATLRQLRDSAVKLNLTPAHYLDLLHQQASEHGDDYDDWLPALEQALALEAEPVATSAPGIAQECLLRLLATNLALRRFFADLARRSGVMHRNAIRLEAAAYERVMARALGFNPARRAYDQFLASLEPWRVDEAMTNAEIEGAIGAYFAERGLPWGWLARTTYGAFTWYVDALVNQFWDASDVWSRETMRPARTPLPDDLATLEYWYWNESDRPVVPEDKSFPGIHIFRGDTMDKARARVRAYVDELERYLQAVERPAVPPGAKPRKRRATIVRNVTWFYRHVVLGESILSLARASASGLGDIVAFDRRKDVRDGIKAARRLLEARPYVQPILNLDEYERGRMHL